jgi:hypothetical protein
LARGKFIAMLLSNGRVFGALCCLAVAISLSEGLGSTSGLYYNARSVVAVFTFTVALPCLFVSLVCLFLLTH